MGKLIFLGVSFILLLMVHFSFSMKDFILLVFVSILNCSVFREIKF